MSPSTMNLIGLFGFSFSPQWDKQPEINSTFRVPEPAEETSLLCRMWQLNHAQ